MVERLTSEQRGSLQAAMLLGFELDEFAARHQDWPQGDLADFWRALEAEIKAKPLKPGQYWAIPSEWY